MTLQNDFTGVCLVIQKKMKFREREGSPASLNIYAYASATEKKAKAGYFLLCIRYLSVFGSRNIYLGFFGTRLFVLQRRTWSDIKWLYYELSVRFFTAFFE